MQNEEKYLCKFDENGKIEAPVPMSFANEYGGIEKLTAEGYIEIPADEYNYYIGNCGDGDNGTGYVRNTATGKPVSAPPRVITKEEKALALKTEYENQAKAIDEAIQIAKNNGDGEYVIELQTDRQNILNKYADKLEELNHD